MESQANTNTHTRAAAQLIYRCREMRCGLDVVMMRFFARAPATSADQDDILSNESVKRKIQLMLNVCAVRALGQARDEVAK